MKLLKELINKKGEVIGDSIIKVDSFLNHQIDPVLMFEMGREFKERFEHLSINKVLTIEASGIAIGTAAAYHLGVPLVFAKKSTPSTMNAFYTSKVHSFTKNKDYDICISKDYINSGDRILIVDDFLAMGAAVLGLHDIIQQGDAELVGVGIAIEKGFQKGSQILRDKGIHVESLAIIQSFQDGKVNFAKK
ncbi:MAG: xanthine phosphoribosyltransferase [Fusobacteriaceae bacterium]